jgi:hypothetical protein
VIITAKKRALTMPLTEKTRRNDLKKKETPLERIDRINKEFDAMLSSGSVEEKKVSIPNDLLRFGLTHREAKSWLKKEPNYSNRKVTTHYEEDENNQRGNRTHLDALYKGRGSPESNRR